MHVGRIRKRLNIENRNSPINMPSQNVYGISELHYSKSLKKEKKKFPGIAYGYNETAPDYLQINYINSRNKHQNFNPHYFNKIHNLDPGENYSKYSNDFNGSIKCFSFNSNSETKKFLDNPIDRRIYEYAPKQRKFNILSGEDQKVVPLSPKSNNYFSNLVELNMFIRKNDQIKKKLSEKRVYRYNDGIKDFLNNNGYI